MPHERFLASSVVAVTVSVETFTSHIAACNKPSLLKSNSTVGECSSPGLCHARHPSIMTSAPRFLLSNTVAYRYCCTVKFSILELLVCTSEMALSVSRQPRLWSRTAVSIVITSNGKPINVIFASMAPSARRDPRLNRKFDSAAPQSERPPWAPALPSEGLASDGLASIVDSPDSPDSPTATGSMRLYSRLQVMLVVLDGALS